MSTDQVKAAMKAIGGPPCEVYSDVRSMGYVVKYNLTCCFVADKLDEDDLRDKQQACMVDLLEVCAKQCEAVGVSRKQLIDQLNMDGK